MRTILKMMIFKLQNTRRSNLSMYEIEVDVRTVLKEKL